MTNELDYVSTPIPEDGVFKISPSAFSTFIERPHAWYRQEILEEDVFEYNTSSVLGTCVHYCAEKVAKGEEVDEEEIERYIASKEVKEDYDPEVVRAQWYPMAACLINDYVLQVSNILGIEQQVCAEVKDGFYAAGTSDLLEGEKSDCMITDYKTYSSKTKPKTIPSYYKYQLLVYAWILTQLGYTVTRVRLVYVNRHIEGEISEKTGRQLKSYPPEATVLTETIEDGDLDFIQGLLELCVDTYKASEEYPHLRHVLWHDPRLAP